VVRTKTIGSIKLGAKHCWGAILATAVLSGALLQPAFAGCPPPAGEKDDKLNFMLSDCWIDQFMPLTQETVPVPAADPVGTAARPTQDHVAGPEIDKFFHKLGLEANIVKYLMHVNSLYPIREEEIENIPESGMAWFFLIVLIIMLALDRKQKYLKA